MKPQFTLRASITVMLTALVLYSCNEITMEDFASSRIRAFDTGWKFLRDSISGAEAPGFDDSGWRLVDLPHDWSMDDLPGEDSDSQTGPFSRESPGTSSTGYVMGGTAWYRKHFTVEAKDRGKIHLLTFDGVYMESDAWLNGHHLGYHPYGYTAFRYDLTAFLNPPGEENILAVRVHNTGANSRWYSGSGIYRHVCLSVLEPLHIDDRGTFIYTGSYSQQSARIRLEISLVSTLAEDRQVTIHTGIIDEQGKVVTEFLTADSMPGNSTRQLVQEIDIPSPALWTTSAPSLYRARISVSADGELADIHNVTFGIRTVSVSAGKGLMLNGEPVLLKGACMHHDNGLLGAAAFDRSEERRVEIMKANGFNAIRTSHNPPSSAFLDACDRLGMLVIDEAFDMWSVPKREMDYSRFFDTWHEADMRSMLCRDRNHPSIIIWSIGNEIPERADTSGVRTAKELIEPVRELDPTRPVTNAICDFWDHPGMAWDETAPAFEPLDIGGYNYQWRKYEADHEKYPSRIMMGTESIPMEAMENWEMVMEHPWIIGDFVWTGMDYLGEVGIGHTRYIGKGDETGFAMPWPWYISWCGDIDICGNKKPQSFYRDVVWGNSSLEMAVKPPVPEGKREHISYWGWPDEYQSWNWSGYEGRTMQVRVFSAHPAARLELNGTVRGEQSGSGDFMNTFVFELPYEPGELTATALDGGEEMGRISLVTTGKPASLHLEAERPEIKADRGEVAYIRIEVRDEQDRPVPDASLPVAITVSGPAELIAAGNADPAGMESVKDHVCRTFRGHALCIIRSHGSAGTIAVSANSPGIAGSSTSITAGK